MRRFLKDFLREDQGAITVDWVILTAAIVGLSIGVTALIFSGAREPSRDLASTLDAYSQQEF